MAERTNFLHLPEFSQKRSLWCSGNERSFWQKKGVQSMKQSYYCAEIEAIKDVLSQAAVGLPSDAEARQALKVKARQAQAEIKELIHKVVEEMKGIIEESRMGQFASQSLRCLEENAAVLTAAIEQMWVQYARLERQCQELDMLCGQSPDYLGQVLEPPQIHNPYLRDFKELSCLREYYRLEADGDAHRASLAFCEWNLARQSMRSRYSWAIPASQVIFAIKRYGPIIEGGAGTGYWGYMLQQAGVDWLGFDCSPVDVRANGWHPGAERPWCEVVESDESMIARHRERTLFLCCPPNSGLFASRALELYQGEYFLLVGDLDSFAANARFLELLRFEWLLISQMSSLSWPTTCDSLSVFWRKRKGGADLRQL